MSSAAVPALRAIPDEVRAKVAPVTLAGDHLLPLISPLAAVVPWGGLRRGTSISVQGSAGFGATSLALALIAEATQRGSWAVVVGIPSIGLTAAAELGVALERLAVIERPKTSMWASVVGALIGSFDLVMVSPQHRLPPSDQRRLSSRARERGTVMMSVAADPIGTSDLSFKLINSGWEGVGEGHGYLRSRQVLLEVGGRREASRPTTVRLRLPGASGKVEVVDDLDDPHFSPASSPDGVACEVVPFGRSFA